MSETLEKTVELTVVADDSVEGSSSIALREADTDELQEGQERGLPTWEAEIAFEGMATSDGRFLIPGEMDNRELPMTLMAQMVTADGHNGAKVAGKITEIWREERPELGEGVSAVMARGEFSDDPETAGRVAASLVEDEVLRGVSVDIAASERVPLDPETHEEIPEDDLSIEMLLSGGVLTGIKGTYMGATLVPFPAFGEATMRIVEVDGADGDEDDQKKKRPAGLLASAFSGSGIKLVEEALTAAAAGAAPLKPPHDWFFRPEPDYKCPLTVTDDGHVYGHLATWDQCHMGLFNRCVLAKPSRSNYSFFHVGSLKTAEGETVQVGRLIVGDEGHADVYLSADRAKAFYDKTGLVAAFVRAVDGRFGIWLSGAVRSDCPAERVRDMLANPPSGDWRPGLASSGLELIAALSVPVPGFPVPYAKIGLVASAGPDGVADFTEDDVVGMVASGYVPAPTMSRSEIRRKEVLISDAQQALSG